MPYKKVLFSIVVSSAVLYLILTFYRLPQSMKRTAPANAKTFRIMHVMSYHTPWQWTEDQVRGFKSGLGSLSYEYREFQMNSKAFSSRDELLRRGKEAMNEIEKFKPDLLYTSDDSAQEYVAARYVNTELPIVFSGVNSDPAVYGFTKSRNVTGIVEEEHFIQSINFLREINPSIRKIAVILDDDPAWNIVVGRCKAKADARLQDITFTGWNVIRTFREYKQTVTGLQTKADAIFILAWYHFKDDRGVNVPENEVARWTAENSRLPDVSLWKDRVSKGTLCSVYIPAFEQGLGAGKAAKRILVERVKPSDIPIKPSVKGMPVVSLYRAKKLGLKIDSSILLESEVIRKAAWEN
jgi:ABC-type uncharacterized transport system substrate-binding protein